MLQSNEKKHSIFGWFHLYTLVGWTPILDVAPLKRYTQSKGERNYSVPASMQASTNCGSSLIFDKTSYVSYVSYAPPLVTSSTKTHWASIGMHQKRRKNK